MDVLPSVPNPHQRDEDALGGLGAPGQASAADNAIDMPRNPQDQGTSGEVITGIGDQMPGTVNTKNTHHTGNNPLAKGSDRYDKHTRDKESEFDETGGAAPYVEPPPGEENLSQQEIRDQHDL